MDHIRGRASQASGRRFTYYSYGAAAALLQSLASLYPGLASLSTTQDTFGLPPVGKCQDDHGVEGPCLNYVLEITNRTGSEAERRARPQIYISGALHGDEQVGVVTALELCRWLTERYDSDPWVQRLVDTRTILISPMTNAIGSAQRTRNELGIDPNRDFPFDQLPRACMQTVAARSVNELYRSHMLQLVITFHGGMQAIGYNWGAFPYYRGQPHHSPDDNAMRDIAGVMSRFAGTGHVQNNRPYPFSTMNDVVYPVHGGMEDWGYAASWDTAYVTPCTPTINGGYTPDKTTYDSAAVRAITILVETSDMKIPPEDTLGGVDGVYRPSDPTDGHVPRNMRLALAAIDLLQPHVQLAHAPASHRVQPARCLPVQWQVWGAVSVDDSVALWRESSRAPWVELPFIPAGGRRSLSSHARVAPRPPTAEGMRVTSRREMGADNGTLVEGRIVGGAGVWGGESPFAPATLSGCVRPPARTLGGQIALSVRADTAWAQPPRGPYAPKRSPQSHLARSRADAGYQSLYRGFEVAGRTRWLSEPIEVNCSIATGCCAADDLACSRVPGPVAG